MKQKGDELIVINKRVFILILAAISVIGIIIGYTIGYITTPVKEVYVQKENESEKTVLSHTVETAFAKKQEQNPVQIEQKKEQPEKPKSEEPEKKEPQVEIVKKEDTKQNEVVKPVKEIPSRKAHRHLGMKELKASKHAIYTIQVGAFSDSKNAKDLQERLNKEGYRVFLVQEDLYKVRMGNYQKYAQAKKISEELKSKGIESYILKVSQDLKGDKK